MENSKNNNPRNRGRGNRKRSIDDARAESEGEEDQAPIDLKPLFPPNATPDEVLAALAIGEVEWSDIEYWSDEHGLECFWKFLHKPPVFDDLGGYWSPNMARAWIRYRDLEKVGEVCEGRLRVVGIWIPRRRPPTILDDLAIKEANEEAERLVGSEYMRDLRDFHLTFKLLRHDASGHLAMKTKVAPIIEARDKKLLNSALETGEIIASGCPKDSASRVEIPALEWIDLHEHRSNYALPDTVFSTVGAHYRYVRVSAAAVMARWPAVTAAPSADHPEALSPEQRLKNELIAGAIDGVVPDKVADRIRKSINENCGSEITREAAFAIRDALGLKGKQGRRRNNL